MSPVPPRGIITLCVRCISCVCVCPDENRYRFPTVCPRKFVTQLTCARLSLSRRYIYAFFLVVVVVLFFFSTARVQIVYIYCVHRYVIIYITFYMYRHLHGVRRGLFDYMSRQCTLQYTYLRRYMVIYLHRYRYKVITLGKRCIQIHSTHK